MSVIDELLGFINKAAMASESEMLRELAMFCFACLTRICCCCNCCCCGMLLWDVVVGCCCGMMEDDIYH